MKKRIYLLLLSMLLFTGCSGTKNDQQNVNSENTKKKYVESIDDDLQNVDVEEMERSYEEVVADTPVQADGGSFAYKLNSQFDQNKNYVFSPFGLKATLAMCANGADGSTKDEILALLVYDDIDTLNNDVKNSESLFSDEGDIKLNSAYSLWINNEFPEIDSDFENVISNGYNAHIERVSLEKLPEKTGEWISENTDSDLKVFPPSVGEDFALSFINAMNLKADWKCKFSADSSFTAVFHNADGTECETEYMTETIYCPAYSDDEVSMVKLDYRDDTRDISFYAAMAAKNTDLENYIEKLKKSDVELRLPVFKTQSNIKMNEIISRLGAGEMFGSSADFCNIFEENRNIFVSSVIQNTMIEVDEEGTTAGVVTEIEAEEADDYEDVVKISFNKPFTYFIRDNTSGEILFMGRFANAE